MQRISPWSLWLFGVLMVGAVFYPGRAAAQEEVASALRRYKAYEASTGYYEEYEVLPQRQRPLISTPNIRTGLLPQSPTAARVRIRTHLADSHQGLRFYTGRTCESCHTEAAGNIHSTRGNITCRQCHGGEPIASIGYYYSPLNPIRRHAYVCSKCHEGANASYATYVVHEPNPALASTLGVFPVLAYGFWIMIAIAVGTFALFLPHTLLWGLRELFVKTDKEKADRELPDKDTD